LDAVPIYNAEFLSAPGARHVAASIYMTLGRITQLTDGDKHSWVPHRWMTRFFVLGDIFAFTLQGSGTLFIRSSLRVNLI
jgi:RTA1 like protein